MFSRRDSWISEKRRFELVAGQEFAAWPLPRAR